MREDLEQLSEALPATVIVLSVLCVAWLVSRALKRVIGRLARGGHLTGPMAERLQAVRRWLLWLVAGLIALQSAGLFAYAWALVSALIAAVAVGFFATWSVLSNATSAILILTFRPFRVGDRVELVEPTNGTSLAGAVVDMNLMYTSLHEKNPETGESRVLYVPNNLFLQKLVRVPGPRPEVTEPFFRDSLDAVTPPAKE